MFFVHPLSLSPSNTPSFPVRFTLLNHPLPEFLRRISRILCIIMAFMSVVIELDGSQHGRGFFHIKALAMNSLFGRRCCIRKFDTTDLLNATPDAWRTYSHQSATHGRPILDSGIPSSSAMDSLSSFLEAAVLDELERVKTAPTTLVLWVKGHQKLLLLQDLLGSFTLDDLNLCVRNLEDIGCPSLKRLMPSHLPMTTRHKLQALTDWMQSHL